MNERSLHDEPAPVASSPVRRPRRRAVGLALGLLVVIGATSGYLWLRHSGGVTSQAETTLRRIAATNGLALDGRLADLPDSKQAVVHRSSRANDDAQFQLKATRQNLEQHLVRRPTPDGHRALGRVYLAEGRPLAAFAHLQLALQQSPGDARLHSDCGLALLEVARRTPEAVQEALEAFDEALRLQPDLLEARYNRARALEMAGRRAEALDAWRDYARRDPQSAWGAAARDRIAFLERYQ
ncbi:MAG: tetratricopeptide repeat protein [Chloracidobacterium sp.]|nr:tetratricopeptide repeat protein [Chloracidobacterium sp.]MDW8217217.1 tetratricopeptide repeat protein [Acidobacteriota bacterium]